MGVMIFGIRNFKPKNGCGPMIALSVPVLDTPWVAEVRFSDCGYGIGGGLDIVALNKYSESIVVLARGNDVLLAKLSSSEPSELQMVLPNRSDIILQTAPIQGFNIRMVFTPENDPADRANYLAWTQDKLKFSNREWFCKNVLAKMSEPSRSIQDEALAYTYYIPHGSHKSYCHQNET